MNQRRFNFQQSMQNNANSIYGQQQVHDAKMMLPPELERTYQVFIVHG
jgi:hypothetical protein